MRRFPHVLVSVFRTFGFYFHSVKRELQDLGYTRPFLAFIELGFLNLLLFLLVERSGGCCLERWLAFLGLVLAQGDIHLLL